MSGRGRPRSLAWEAFGTGTWLGATQVGLGFALLVSAASSVRLFFLLLAVWIAGGAMGSMLARRGLLLPLTAAVLSSVAARRGLVAWPTSDGAVVLGLAAGLLSGA